MRGAIAGITAPVLSGRYAPVPLPAIAEYFELLARAGAFSLQ